MIYYLYHFPSLPINLRSAIGDIVTCYVDASFATHIDCKSHSGMIVTIGENGGPIQAKSKMQNIHTDSSCEAELVGAVTCSNFGLFLARLMAEIGLLNCEKVIMHLKQDNTSTIKIMENG